MFNKITCPAGLVFNHRTGICTWPDEAHKTGCSSEGKSRQMALHMPNGSHSLELHSLMSLLLCMFFSHRIVPVHMSESRWRNSCYASTIRWSRRLPILLCVHQWWTTETKWLQIGPSLWRCYQTMQLGTKNSRMVRINKYSWNTNGKHFGCRAQQ